MKIEKYISLLQHLIKTPSFSGHESRTGDILMEFFDDADVSVQRSINNIWVQNQHFDPAKPTILLNSHHDTVQPNQGYTFDPFKPEIIDGKLRGLGSNDAGGPLVSLAGAFMHFYHRKDLKKNLLFLASAEEETSGENGMRHALSLLPEIELAIVGEPTEMHMATAEKGLMVLDCKVIGMAGHAARDLGKNAIYLAMKEIEWFQNFQFPKVSDVLGSIKMTVTVMHAGAQHNVIPDQCDFVVDVRTTDAYSNAEILEIIRSGVSCEVSERSRHLDSSGFDADHPIIKAGIAMGRHVFGSPTLSDQCLMHFPSFKMGPGKSERSHTSDEFIYVKEIEEAIPIYIKMLETVLSDS